MRKDKYLQQIGEVPTPGDPVVKVDEKDGGEAEASGESRERDETEDSKDRKDRTETKSSVSLGKRKARAEEVEKERKRLEEGGMSRERVTERMVRVDCVYPFITFVTCSLLGRQKTRSKRAVYCSQSNVLC